MLRGLGRRDARPCVGVVRFHGPNAREKWRERHLRTDFASPSFLVGAGEPTANQPKTDYEFDFQVQRRDALSTLEAVSTRPFDAQSLGTHPRPGTYSRLPEGVEQPAAPASIAIRRKRRQSFDIGKI